MTTRRLMTTFILLAQWSILSAGAFYQTKTLSETEYWDLIQQAEKAVQQDDTEFDEIIAGLETSTIVQLNSGEIVPVDNRLLVNTLRAEPFDKQQALAILQSLLNARRQFPNRIFSSADLDSLKAITARPEFQWRQAQPGKLEEWWQGVLDQFLRWLERILGNGQRSGQGEAGQPSSIPLIASVLLALILFFVFRTLFADLIQEVRAKNGEDDAAEALTADTAFEKAQTLSRGGDYRSAVRYLYLSSLLRLDERGMLRYDRSKTNREYLRSVAKSPELARPLAEVIDVFDNVWYGYHSLDEETFRHYSKRVEELKEKRP